MTATIAVYEPINTLKAVADGVWLVDGPLIDLNDAGLMAMAAHFGDGGSGGCHSR
jgi:hypothetical protein